MTGPVTVHMPGALIKAPLFSMICIDVYPLIFIDARGFKMIFDFLNSFFDIFDLLLLEVS